jgi:hypothetical protein
MGLVEKDLEPSFRVRICDRQSEWGYWTSRIMGGYYWLKRVRCADPTQCDDQTGCDTSRAFKCSDGFGLGTSGTEHRRTT